MLAAAFGLGATSLYFYTLGLMIVPLSTAFGWSQAQITSGPIIISIFYFFLASRIGALVDRLGPRAVVVPGYAGFCLALAALGLAGPSIWSWYALWALMALIFTFTAPSLWAMAVVSRFDRARALALSVALCSTGVMAALTPVIEAALIQSSGWRVAYFVLGGGMLVIGLPIVWSCLPRHVARPAESDLDAALRPGLTFGEALRSPRFWMIAASSLLIGAGIAALMVHLPPIGLAQGLSTAKVAAITGLIGITAIGGRLLTGLLMDRFAVRMVGAVVFAMPLIACLILAYHPTAAMMTVSALLIGVVSGGDYNVLALLTSRYLGMRSYAAIYSQIAAAFNIGVGLGPAVMGAFHDHVGRYPPLLIGLGFVFAITAMLTVALGREPNAAGPAR